MAAEAPPGEEARKAMALSEDVKRPPMQEIARRLERAIA